MPDEKTFNPPTRPMPPTPSEMPMYDKTLAEAGQFGSVEVSALPHTPTVTELLMHKKASLEAQLAAVNAALAQAAIQKDTMGLLDAIAKTRVKQEY